MEEENQKGNTQHPDVLPHPLQRWIIWILLNGFIGFLTLKGLFLKEQWALNILLFVVWVLTILYTFTSFSESAKLEARRIGPPVPRWLSILFNLIIVFCLASAGHFVSAAAWTWQILCCYMTYDFRRQENNKTVTTQAEAAKWN